MELIAPRMTVAEGGVGGRGPAVSLQRPGISADISAQTVEAKQVGIVMASPARETRPVEERSSGTDELVHRQWHGVGL
ncbi:hypothetical protein [Streptomyces sp. NPDC002922]|uniref:hypothetical protein n=1 Tax=Streptomyces sp. NPDC002922 TaxID=3154439 RepID=UPI0033A16575